MAALNLDACMAKLRRADEHMDSVKRQIHAWMDRNPYRGVQQTNPEHTRHSFVFKVIHAPDIERWSLVTGDAFHNLRCVLDHLVYAVAVNELDPARLTDKVAKGLAFPICDGPSDFKSKYWRIEPLSQPVKATVEALQPYNRRHPQLPPLLAILRDFDDLDKHRTLQLAMSQPVDGQFQNISEPIPSGATWTVDFHTGEIVDGTEIVALTTDRPTPKMNYKFKARIGITVPIPKAAPDVARSDPGGLYGIVRDEVLFVVEEVKRSIG